MIYLYVSLLHGVRSKVNQTHPRTWQTKIYSMYKDPKWIGLKMQAYTSSSKTGERMGMLSHIRNQESKLKVYGLERKQECKSDAIVAFTHVRALNLGKKNSFSAYIQKVRRVVDLCNFACVGDCKDRLIRNSIVAGLLSTKAYQQCISKGSSLSLSKCIRICQTEDATCSLQNVGTVHQSTNWLNILSSRADQATGAEDTSGVADPATGMTQPQGPGPRDNTNTVLRLHVNSVGQTLTSLRKNVEPSAMSVIIVGGLDIS